MCGKVSSVNLLQNQSPVGTGIGILSDRSHWAKSDVTLGQNVCVKLEERLFPSRSYRLRTPAKLTRFYGHSQINDFVNSFGK